MDPFGDPGALREALALATEYADLLRGHALALAARLQSESLSLEALRAHAVAAAERLRSNDSAVGTMLSQETFLYVNQAGSSEALSPSSLELDTVVLGLALLMTAHALLHRRLLWLLLYFAVGALLEQAAVRFGGTHCHAEALVMLSQCSSAASVAVCAAALYVCQVAAARLPLSALARPFAVGLLVCVYCTPHVLQGAGQGWWAWAAPAPAPSSSAAAAAAASFFLGAGVSFSL